MFVFEICITIVINLSTNIPIVRGEKVFLPTNKIYIRLKV